MEVIGLLGFLVIFGSFVYLVYHFIRRVKNKERVLNKKMFYPILSGGFLLFVIGLIFTDTGVKEQLDEAIEVNATLVAENKELQSNNTTLKEDYDKSNKELEDLSLKLADFDKSQQNLKDLQVAHVEETESLEEQIADLKAKNTALTTEVDSLKKQVASKGSNSTANSNGGSSGSSAPAKTTTSAPAVSSGSEWFQNCTELRKKYPSGVAQGHAAYASKHDRDKDGWACE